MADQARATHSPQTARRAAISLLCAVALLGLTGSSCPQMVRQYKLPSAAARPLTLSEVTLRINENSNRVRSLSSTSATLSGPQFPSLKASLAVERPRRFRLIAEKTGLTGSEFDLGSNDELFWFWVKRNQPPALYFCRHEQFAASAAKKLLPVEPEWLIEALGIVNIDPATVQYEPASVGAGRARIEATVASPEGPRRKVIVFDAEVGAVTEEHVYDPAGTLLATVTMSGHERDEASGAILPRTIDIQWPATQFAMKIQLHDVVVNQISGDPAQLWSKPEYSGWPDVDLADPRVQLPPMASMAPPLAALPEDADSTARRFRLFRWR